MPVTPFNPFESYRHVLGVVCMPVLFGVLLLFFPLPVTCLVATAAGVMAVTAALLCLLGERMAVRQAAKGNEHAVTWPGRRYLCFVFVCSISGVVTFGLLIAGFLAGWLAIHGLPILAILMLAALVAMIAAAGVWLRARNILSEYTRLQEQPAAEPGPLGPYLSRQGIWNGGWLISVALYVVMTGVWTAHPGSLLVLPVVLLAGVAMEVWGGKGRRVRRVYAGVAVVAGLCAVATGVAHPAMIASLAGWGVATVLCVGLLGAAGWYARRDRAAVSRRERL